MNEQAVTVLNDRITIRSQYFSLKDNTCTNKEWLQDILSKHYQGQSVYVEARDGENIRASGFLGLLDEFSIIFKIPPEQIFVETHDTNLESPFEFTHLPLGLFLGANKYIPAFERNLEEAKFIGCAIGRFTPTRLRLAYELDLAFPKDNFMIFQGRNCNIDSAFAELYRNEIDWFSQKKFDLDIVTNSPIGAVGFDSAYSNYPNIWNCYQIEVVIETDPVSDFWFTEKTAKCLATGKPFVLVNGYRSLQKLKDMGFETFQTEIDESYDESYTPTQRIDAIVNSLKELYTNKHRQDTIKQMYDIAQLNQEHYKTYVTSQGHNV